MSNLLSGRRTTPESFSPSLLLRLKEYGQGWPGTFHKASGARAPGGGTKREAGEKGKKRAARIPFHDPKKSRIHA